MSTNWRGSYYPEKPGLYEVRWTRVNPDSGTTTITGTSHWNGDGWDVAGVQCWRPLPSGHADDPGPVGPIATEPDVPGVLCWEPLPSGHQDDSELRPCPFCGSDPQYWRPGPVGTPGEDGIPGQEEEWVDQTQECIDMPARPHSKEGVKHDSGKLRMDLIPPEAITALAEVLTHGAEQYGDRNWEKGIKYSRIFAAVQRHLWAWWQGEDMDAESNLGHLQHALCGLAFLVTYEDWDMEHLDDRS